LAAFLGDGEVGALFCLLGQGLAQKTIFGGPAMGRRWNNYFGTYGERKLALWFVAIVEVRFWACTKKRTARLLNCVFASAGPGRLRWALGMLVSILAGESVEEAILSLISAEKTSFAA